MEINFLTAEDLRIILNEELDKRFGPVYTQRMCGEVQEEYLDTTCVCEVLHISTKAVTTKDNDGVKAGTEITFKPRWVVTSDKDTQIRDGMAFWGTAKVGDVKKKGKKLFLPSIGAGHGAYEYDRLNKIEMD